MQGFEDHAGNNTILFIHWSQILFRRKETYTQSACLIRPQKTETHQVRLTSGGKLIQYIGDIRTPTVDIKLIKPTGEMSYLKK